MEVEEEDLDFEALVRELSSDISAAEYVNFDADIPASEPMINEHEIDWRQKIREDCTNAIMNPNTLSEETQEISDDYDDEEEEEIDFAKLLTMLDKIKRCSALDDESQEMLSIITKKIEYLQLANKKQKSIKAYFT